jgi:hypothetical protein
MSKEDIAQYQNDLRRYRGLRKQLQVRAPNAARSGHCV